MDTAETVSVDQDALESMMVRMTADVMQRLNQSSTGAPLEMSKAWVYQRPEQVKRLGENCAPYYVGWFDPDRRRHGKSFGPGPGSKREAYRFRRQVEAELLTGTYGTNYNRQWSQFRAEYEKHVVKLLKVKTQQGIRAALDTFERIAKPGRVSNIKTMTIDLFIAARHEEKSQQSPGRISPATVNKELRDLKAALKKAWKWKYLLEMPDVNMLKEPKKLPCYVLPEHFEKIYAACESARLPRGVTGYNAPDWWRALLLLIMLTGWRIGQALALRRDDVNFETGEVFSHAEDNKGGRDMKLVLHPLALDGLRRLRGFTALIFPWPHHERRLWHEFLCIQTAAGVRPDRKDHYGFHDLRRAFATMNADRLTPDALQRLMQHKDYQTTQGYIAMARQLRPAADNLYVPTIPHIGVS
jgi:integrase